MYATRGAYGGQGGGLGAGLRHIEWDLSQLPVFEKNFYIEHPEVSKRSAAEAEAWRGKKQVSIEGRGVPKPVYTFEEASMPDYVLSEVIKQGFKEPSPQCPKQSKVPSNIVELLYVESRVDGVGAVPKRRRTISTSSLHCGRDVWN